MGKTLPKTVHLSKTMTQSQRVEQTCEKQRHCLASVIPAAEVNLSYELGPITDAAVFCGGTPGYQWSVTLDFQSKG